MKKKEFDYPVIISVATKVCRKSSLGRPRKRWEVNI
jgi:hypothetical protein